MMWRVFLFIATVLTASGSAAQERWQATELTNHGLPPEIVAETRQPAPSGIAHMLTAELPAEAGRSDAVVRAWYSQPTSRYRHGVLGDAIEGGALVAELANGRRMTYRLAETLVFEDIAPRIADLDGDGRREIVTVMAHLRKGAAVAIFAVSGDVLTLKAQSPFIGIPNRWLNIAEIAPISGGNTPDIAIVTTPHIGGRLGLLKYAGGGLAVFAGATGFSNHLIGSPELRLSAIADIDGDRIPELALPSADRSSLRIMAFDRRGLVEKARAVLPGRIDKAILARNESNAPSFVVGLEDGRVFEVKR